MNAVQHFAVIGDPIAHSWSPQLHATLFRAAGQNARYDALRVIAAELGKAAAQFRRTLAGFNVTIPHKRNIIPFLDRLDPSAQLYGAVNTVRVEGGLLVGYNTDAHGFRAGWGSFLAKLQGQSVLLIGAGGSAQVAARELTAAGCRLTITNRTAETGRTLAAALPKIAQYRPLDHRPRTPYFAIVNTTPVGMSPGIGDMPVAPELLNGAAVVYDLIYNPWQTRLLQTAAAHGCRTINGWPMLFYQAVRAQEIWLGCSLDPAALKAAYDELSTAVSEG